MQHGYSKDHRPDLPQLKLMAAAAEPSGHLLACDVLAGHNADDPLYLPMLARVRQIVGKSGLLYTGDSKMAALETRADIVAHNVLSDATSLDWRNRQSDVCMGQCCCRRSTGCRTDIL